MAKLYFRYGVMGSSKSANALMVRYNYEERGQRALMVKPDIDQREGKAIVNSRIGLNYPCVWFDELRAMTEAEIKSWQCIIVDEAQFLTREEVMYLVDLVDCADIIEEIKTICWCGRKATCNARFDETGKVLKEGEQVVLGANDKYIGLCRRHWKEGNLGPDAQ